MKLARRCLCGLLFLPAWSCTAGTAQPDLGAADRAPPSALFAEKRSMRAPIFSTVLALGDVNGDGKLDLVTANQSAELAVLINLGLGPSSGGVGFRLVGAYDARGNTAEISLGDFEGNHNVEVALALFGNRPGVAIFPVKKDGTLGAPVLHPAGQQPRALASADFNRDGKQDLAVAAAASQTVEVLLGGALEAGSYPVPLPEAIVAADLNSDGRVDLTVGGDADGMNMISTLLGEGEGSFVQGPVHMLPGMELHALAAADLNGDHITDLVVGTGDPGIALLWGRGDGSFVAGPTLVAGPDQAAVDRIVISSFRQGHRDLAVLLTPPSGPSLVNVLLGAGDGSFAPPITIGQVDSGGVTRASLQAGDIDGDGRQDLAVSEGELISIFINQGG